ncbi:hypothetical protein [Sinorhizobium medicae]|uniref:hypothetical protein n=1 Tax=Sinorhizobium medicae TaxID=110321 RepID=UPI000FD7446E|nr:hypothetical protein [Sinorhizobium medicae]RVJ72545.1 hypothetical protein CN168_26765 [Sinorhizobium medicae]
MKQAVVVIHGMGEQVPMQTLQDFVEAVWVTDDGLIRRSRPDSATGGPRQNNAVWYKPDRRNRSFELRRMTTESLDGGREATDFYEFYWAHLMHGTTWEHFKTWLLDLLLRSPRRVPPRVRSAWIALWCVTVLILAGILVAGILPTMYGERLKKACAPEAFFCWWTLLPSMVVGGSTLAFGTFVNVYLLKYFGDVARYVRADPVNVARRQDIREKGVELLETLMGLRSDIGGVAVKYDRVVVVAHSLGTIVAYDVLSHCFARLNTRNNLRTHPPQQPHRVEMEAMIRKATGMEEEGSAPVWDIDAFQRLQALCRKEINAQDNPWIVSDFITLGSPLSHAEFLLAFDKAELRKAQERRILPTCPPNLEYDGKTKLRHFTYRMSDRDGDDDHDPEGPRLPHHAALFAYTRWTNLYSPHEKLLWGDLISGAVGPQFNLEVNGREISGIRDLRVLPERTPEGQTVGGARVPFFSHTKYWQLPGTLKENEQPVHHIRMLREALNLKSG